MKDNTKLALAGACIAVAWAILSPTACEAGEWTTEIGMGYKLEDSTSWLLLPDCKQAVVVNPENSPRGSNPYGCGGNNPAFIGYPIKWESEWHGAWRFNAWYFHYSNWFDGGNITHGGDQWETRMDVIGGSVTFSWNRWLRRNK